MAQIESVRRLNANPARYEALGFVVMLSADWASPYDSADVQLDLRLKSPSGGELVIPAYHESGESGSLSKWMARFAPLEEGEYSGQFVLKARSGQWQSDDVVFSVAPSASKGFLHPASDWTFRYDDGTPFRGMGMNIGWEARSVDDSRYFKALHENPRYNYEYMLGSLAGNGGNFFRTWMCSWNLPLEWNTVINTDRYANHSGRFNPSAIRRMDELVQLCDSLGIHMMLTLDHAGSYIGGEWDINSYNVANGGPASSLEDFFTNPLSIQRYKDRLRYIVARWGYSPSIGAWEFWNEVDNAMYSVEPRISDEVVSNWHRQMADYLKSIDPAHRLVTTSVSHRDVQGLNDIDSIDFNQRHIYKATSSIPDAVRNYAARHGKPYVIGEFSYEWDWSKDFNAFAEDMDRDFSDGLWLGLFSSTPVLPMSWWWEFFDSRGMTSCYANVRTISDLMLEAGDGSMERIDASWSGDEGSVMGVSCRSGGGTGKLFFLIRNEAERDIAGVIRFQKAEGVAMGAVLAFDTATGAFSAGADCSFKEGWVELQTPELKAGRNLVMIVQLDPEQ